jgi:hypothetical protein
VLPLELGSHRLLGDGRSVALLRPDGEVAWWCAPDVDSPPVLWRLLDPAGAAARWCDALVVSADGPPAGPALTTVLRVRGRRIECRDGLLPLGPGGAPALVRLVRGLEDDLAVTHESVRGELGGDVQRCTLPVSAPGGTWAGVVLDTEREWHAAEPDVLLARLDDANQAVERAVAGALVPGGFVERARDSLRVLTACRYLATGAVVASPTTSVPESVDGDRQFDYRYAWMRDAALAVSAASLLGQGTAARAFLRFALEHMGGDPLHIAPVRTVHGGPVPPEREVNGVAGWAGTLPVRVGNNAGEQEQHDTLGLFVEAVSVHVQTGGSLDDRTWRGVRTAADAVAGLVLAGPPPRTAGIWELRDPRQLVSEDIARWVTLDRALWVARGWRPGTAATMAGTRRRWRRARSVVRDRVLGALRPDGTLPGAYDGDAPEPDAAALLAVVFGLLDGGDPRAARLVDATLHRLGSGPWLYRYPPAGDRGGDGASGSDGFHGREGAFLPASILAVSALAQVGRVREAEARMGAICAVLPRLLPEMVDPADGTSLGNTPLLWSHMELVRALYLLDVARRRQRWGTLGLTVWRVVRYVRLRRRSDDS